VGFLKRHTEVVKVALGTTQFFAAKRLVLRG